MFLITNIRTKTEKLNKQQYSYKLRVLTCLLALALLSIQTASAESLLLLAPYIGIKDITELSKENSKNDTDRKELTVGISNESSEPYEITQGNYLKGISADYLSIIGKKLGLQIRILTYRNHKSAIQALQSGEIDIYSNTLSNTQLEPGFALSIPYALDHPVIVGRGAELEFSKINPQGEIAFLESTLSTEELTKLLPNATPIPYDSALRALHAVEYRKHSWFIGDPATVSFYIGQGELGQLHTYTLKSWPKIGHGFLFRNEDEALLSAVNEIISNIEITRKEQILNYWANKPEHGKSSPPLYTLEEKSWLSTHPNVRVAINGSLPPYSFYDDSGDIRGVVIDLLAEISQNTGINFTLVDYSTLSDLEASLRNSKTDMALTLLPNPEREQYLKFTDPFLYNSFALVTSLKSKASSLDDSNIKKIAIQRSNFVEAKIASNHPGIELLKKDSQLDSLISIANGESDAAVTLLPTATYLIRQYFSEDLKVSTSLPDFQANLPFSVRNDEPLLYSIMSKVTDQLKPGYINGLMSEWKGVPPARKSVWRDYTISYRTFYIAAITMVMFALSFIAYLAYKRNRAMQEAERFKFRSTLLDSIPMAISLRDLEGRFVFCNQVFYSQLRTTPDAVIGRLTSEFMGLPPDEAREQERLYFRTLERGMDDQRQLDATVNGLALTLRQWDRPFTDNHGSIAGLISGYADVTANVLLLQQLREARDIAVQANEAKSRFLAVMSHEIRTPLNAIIGLLELTIQRISRGESYNREDLEVAYGSSKSLIMLIDDILDLAKIESGKITLVPQRCNFPVITNSVVRIFSGVAQQKNIHLKLIDNCVDSPDISLDAERFKQVLSNLLSNAIKFTDDGGVTVNISCDRVEQGVRILLNISDTGIGISEDDQAELFKPFSQAQSSRHRRGGTGLGLVICRQLIEMMGGKLELYSAPNQGTQVSLEMTAPELKPLPLAAVKPPESRNTMKHKLNVLLVDDHPANRLLLGQQLQFLGHAVHEAEDGAQAFSILLEQNFDLIITDCSMPVMDGYQLTQKWRAHETQHELAPCWIFGFTANAQPDEQARCLDAGMDGCLFKPVSLAELEACLDGLHIRGGERLADKPSTVAPLFDRSSIEKITGGNEKLSHLLITQLRTSNALDLQQLQIKIQDKQWKDLSTLAHRLKGVAKLINSTALLQATIAYEQSFAEQKGEAILFKESSLMKTTLEKLQQSLSEQT